MKLVANLLLLSTLLEPFSFEAKVTCPFGTSLTSTLDTVECRAPRSCSGCNPLILNSTKTLKCSKGLSCYDITADIIAVDGFSLECEDDISCARNRADCAPVITINCDGKSIDGIKCNGRRSCQYSRFVINGGSEGCNVKRIECSNSYSCYGASFELIGRVNIDEFLCGEDSCDNVFCAGFMANSVECPSNLTVPLCSGRFSGLRGFAAGLDDDTKDGNELKSDTKMEYISINLSPSTLGALWGMMAVCLIVNIVLFLVSLCKHKKEQTFDHADLV